MLDTSAYSVLGRGHAEIRNAVQQAERIFVSPIVLGELHAGFGRGKRQKENEALLERFLASPRVEIAVIGEQTALCYSHILNYLRQIAKPIPTNDIWIAAGAMEHSVRLVSTDAHFRAIPQVRLAYYEPAGGASGA
jgi:tRNA(fMet)-specific endonuclease VapC